MTYPRSCSGWMERILPHLQHCRHPVRTWPWWRTWGCGTPRTPWSWPQWRTWLRWGGSWTPGRQGDCRHESHLVVKRIENDKIRMKGSLKIFEVSEFDRTQGVRLFVILYRWWHWKKGREVSNRYFRPSLRSAGIGEHSLQMLQLYWWQEKHLQVRIISGSG